MYIEIRKAGFINKGAELMLYAAIENMKQRYAQTNFVMAPTPNNGIAPYAKRAELGFFQKAWLWKYKFQWGSLASMVPKKIREMYGVILDKEIDVVIDAAGFEYSDQWGVRSCLELAKSSKNWKKRGTKVILLPQAFGPFKSDKIKQAIKQIVDNVDLIFARDPLSYKHLIDITGKKSNIKMAPDFTNLVEGILPKSFDTEKNQFCIVPNYRMVDKTTKEQSEAYIPFMITCARYLIKKNQKPFVLVHEGAKDLMLAERISKGVGEKLPIIVEDHPLKIKGIIGSCKGTIGSRFHGLVSALSQNVPALATGWSHKYKMLFQDYGFSEGLMDVSEDKKYVCGKIDMITQPESREKIISTISSKSNNLKKLTRDMWEQVFEVLKV